MAEGREAGEAPESRDVGGGQTAHLRPVALTALSRWVTEHPDVESEQVSDAVWFVMLAGEHKRTIPVRLEVGQHTLVAQSFFIRAPDENEAALYAYLLGRHLRSYLLRFALHPDGDVLLVGVMPVAAVTPDELDRFLGQLLTVADDAFDQALRLGFGSYIEREQQWRARVGAPRNPLT